MSQSHISSSTEVICISFKLIRILLYYLLQMLLPGSLSCQRYKLGLGYLHHSDLKSFSDRILACFAQGWAKIRFRPYQNQTQKSSNMSIMLDCSGHIHDGRVLTSLPRSSVGPSVTGGPPLCHVPACRMRDSRLPSLARGLTLIGPSPLIHTFPGPRR